MCGIAGMVRTEVPPPEQWDLLAAMSRSISHRGPDDHGFFVSGPVGLAHRRLSIIDVSGGGQPMIDRERGFTLVYNGELYNFQALRRELEAAGTRFVTRSDTEVLLKLASVESFDWVGRLNGIFAFALWHEPSRRLILARDRLGIKPLFFTSFPDEFVFASEIKALLRHPRVSRRINAGRVAEYHAFRSLAGTDTMFEGIRHVSPGTVLVVSQPDISQRTVRFWPPPVPHLQTTIAGDDECRELIKATFSDAVRRQLVSDVPVGMYLSGGVDSSLVTVTARPMTTGAQLHTFSVGFEENGYDESAFAHRVATQVGATHHALIVTESEFVEQLETTARRFDEPLNHAHTVQLELLSRFAKSFVTVVLTGEGADELFGGYPRLQIPLLAERLRWAPRSLLAASTSIARTARLRRIVKLLEASTAPGEAIVESARYVPRADLEALWPEPAFPERDNVLCEVSENANSMLQRMLWFDLRTYLPSLLARLDKASMAAAVECRVPFLDNEMIDLSLRVPAHLKIQVGRENKVALKQIAAEVLPADLVYRRKVGFGTPLADWFRHERGLGRYLELVLDRNARISEFADRQRIASLIGSHKRSEADHSEIIWSLVAFELWCRTIVDAVPAGEDSRVTEPTWRDELTRLRQLDPRVADAAAVHSGVVV